MSTHTTKTKTPLPENVAALLEKVRPTREVVAELKKAAKALDEDPEFMADCLKSQVVEDIYRAFEKEGLNNNRLAQRMGKSRQYVGKILNEEPRANFTIDSLAAISCALKWKLVIRMLPPSEMVTVMKTWL